MFLLRSPLHRLVSESTLLITVRGRKSGRTYTTPVNYVRDGDKLLVVSRPERTWWRNLRDGAPVIVRLKGQVFAARGEVLDEPAERNAAFLTMLQRAPRYRRYLGIHLTEGGEPDDPEAFESVASQQVVVRLSQLTPRSLPSA